MKIIQISDTHLARDKDYRIFGLVNTEDTFLGVLSAIRKEKPDFIIVTGDLSQDGSKESYLRLNSYLSTLDCDVYVIYGNHDNPANFDQYLIGGRVKSKSSLDTEIGRFVFLSSYKKGVDSGYLDSNNLLHLVNNLKANEDCILVMHHHFMILNSLIDIYILENRAEFIQILREYKSKWKLCITGHVHNTYASYLENKLVHSGLSTCIQFAKTPNLLFENKKPGYTIYNFEGNNYKVIEKFI